MGHSIFIGYRRDDTADVTGRIYDRLRASFGESAIFKDVDNLPVGTEFGAHILSILPQCRVFLAMIGPAWLDLRDLAGQRRLDDPEDWVRIELETALATNALQVVPVLVNGAPMPRPEALPASLRPLSRLNAAFVRRDPDFHKDMDRLIEALRLSQITGEVVVDAASAELASGSAGAWRVIENSLDIDDYREFERHFPGTPEVMLAARCRRQLEAWAAVGRDDPDAIVAFRRMPAFGALQEETRKWLDRANRRLLEVREAEAARQRAEAERLALEAQRQAEEEARRKQQELLNQPDNRAFVAAAAGRPIADRHFRDVLSNGTVGPEMIAIPAGVFAMGSPETEVGRSTSEGPKRTVTVPAFAIGRTPISWTEYRAAVADGACEMPRDDKFGGGDRPVTCVALADAQAYCAWLSRLSGKRYRLPSEAEWEYAARAGTTTAFWWGNAIRPDQANYSRDHVDRGNGEPVRQPGSTMRVGSFQANPFGLHDVHGNVWEWTADRYADSYSAGQPSDGTPFSKPVSSRYVARGGSWDNPPDYLRSACRNWFEDYTQFSILGFRIARFP